MKVACPNCKSKVDSKDIKNINKKGIFIKKQCPSCCEWFGLNKAQEVLKTAGILLLLITSLLNIFSIKSEHSLVFSTVGFVGIIIAIIITFFSKHETVK
ncbi:hypothetical protein [Pseudoalteromonas sp. MelDa3]|uniref:hypothetical protein n=1 Tax=Pseudoalteromonas sp. MelDa3 TaxID=888435 RepID=UPI000CA738D1|nr:hypothetical protein [Pseudoalteromonas sp. MelDa3]PLT24511.1 hypothetical protein CXF89_15285 [Pseudoalteromonas sp. MelDa3]